MADGLGMCVSCVADAVGPGLLSSAGVCALHGGCTWTGVLIICGLVHIARRMHDFGVGSCHVRACSQGFLSSAGLCTLPGGCMTSAWVLIMCGRACSAWRMHLSVGSYHLRACVCVCVCGARKHFGMEHVNNNMRTVNQPVATTITT